MGLSMSGQIEQSKKAPVDRTGRIAASMRARRSGPKQEGTLWQRKMRTLALRRPKGRARRHSSGAPMKRG